VIARPGKLTCNSSLNGPSPSISSFHSEHLRILPIHLLSIATCIVSLHSTCRDVSRRQCAPPSRQSWPSVSSSVTMVLARSIVEAPISCLATPPVRRRAVFKAILACRGTLATTSRAEMSISMAVRIESTRIRLVLTSAALMLVSKDLHCSDARSLTRE
jgi:hypothetical protein